jgi:MFS family permease
VINTLGRFRARLRDSTFSSLTVPDFRNFYAGQFLSFTGTWMRRTALGWLVFEKTHSYEVLGHVSALLVLPLLLFAPFAGMLADIFPKRRLIFITNFFLALFSFLLAICVGLDWISIPLLYLLAFCSGTAFAFEVPARQSFIKELIGKEKLLNGIALNSASVNLSRILGPLFAGLILALGPVGYVLVFTLDALSYVVVMLTLRVIRAEGLPLKQTQYGMAYFREGFHTVYRLKPIFFTILLLLVLGIFGWSYQTLLPGIVQEQFQFKSNNAHILGLLMALFGVGASVGAILVATFHHQLNARRSLYVGLSVLSFTLLVMGMFPNYLLFCVLQLPAGFGSIFFLSTANTVIQLRVPDEVRGRVMGIWSLAFGGSIPLGSWLIGYTAEWFGPFESIVGFGVILFAFLHAVVYWQYRSTSAAERTEQA